MKTKFLFLCFALCLLAPKAKAQFVVADPLNIATSIINTITEVVETSTTASNMINNFKETVKLYEQGKEYYDKLKKIHTVLKDARKVQQTILLVGEISDIYVNSFQLMMQDENFTVEELRAIANGYGILMEEANLVLTDLKDVVNENGLSMNDSERMQVINYAYEQMSNYRNLVRYYTNKNIGVSHIRAAKKNTTAQVMALYGTAEERYW
jgi:hypothetical protein